MAKVRLTFEQRKLIMKCYSKFEDVCEGQRRRRREICNSAFNTTNISRIRDKFETGSTVQDVYKRRAG